MTTTETRYGVGLGVHVSYPDLLHEIHMTNEYFAAFAKTWDTCRFLTYYRTVGKRQAVIPTQKTEEGPDPRDHDESGHRVSLRIHYLHIGSPMTVTFAIEGGAAIFAVYCAHLFARVLRDPRRVGAWLPLVVAGWREAWQEADELKGATQQRGRKRTKAASGHGKSTRLDDARRHPLVRRLIDTGNEMAELGMHPDEIFLLGAEEAPDDLMAIVDDS